MVFVRVQRRSKNKTKVLTLRDEDFIFAISQETDNQPAGSCKAFFQVKKINL